MKVGECPSCRAPVEFRPGAGQIKVCEFCQTVVFRGELNLESRGKVAELTDTESPLRLNLSGRYSGTPFTVSGRIQKSNSTGLWDEWCLSFEDERTGWLAESEGEWKLLFPLSHVAPPRVESLHVLQPFSLRDKTFIVEEVGAAHTVSAQGQLPSFHAEHTYVDATGPSGAFCTLDQADGVCEAYIGTFVSLADLGFDESELSPTPRREALRHARCTECNGPLDLKAPDATQRVGCPFCGALLEVQHGALAFLELLKKPPVEPLIPLGAQGALHEPTKPQSGGPAPAPAPTWTCLAFLMRSCTVEGTKYPWQEYLLWNQRRGFRWLMHQNGHWTWLSPVAAGELAFVDGRVKCAGETFRAYQAVYATTEYVMGECYWQVRSGEVALATEFISPPNSINVDQTDHEATVTYGTLVDAAVLEKAFSLRKKLPPRKGLASAQVNQHLVKSREAWTWAVIWGLVLVGLMFVFSVMGNTDVYFNGRFEIPPQAASGSPEAQQFSEPFDIKASVPLEIIVSDRSLANSWVGVSVDLVNIQTNEVIAVYGEPSFYSGVDEGERWSEGSALVSQSTDVVEAGRYLVRVTPTFDAAHPEGFTVMVRADDTVGFCGPLLILLCLLVLPIYHSMRANEFETAKWNDSVFQASA
jgi:LSD1 subclass zinc finger protein